MQEKFFWNILEWSHLITCQVKEVLKTLPRPSRLWVSRQYEPNMSPKAYFKDYRRKKILINKNIWSIFFHRKIWYEFDGELKPSDTIISLEASRPSITHSRFPWPKFYWWPFIGSEKLVSKRSIQTRLRARGSWLRRHIVLLLGTRPGVTLFPSAEPGPRRCSSFRSLEFFSPLLCWRKVCVFQTGKC